MLRCTILPCAMGTIGPEFGMTDSKRIIEAISAKRCIEVTYNRMRMKIAPHILYTKHGDLFLDAVATEREGRALGGPKLGTFKVAGLQIVGLTSIPFRPLPSFEPNDQKYLETTPFLVERG